MVYESERNGILSRMDDYHPLPLPLPHGDGSPGEGWVDQRAIRVPGDRIPVAPCDGVHSSSVYGRLPVLCIAVSCWWCGEARCADLLWGIYWGAYIFGDVGGVEGGQGPVGLCAAEGGRFGDGKEGGGCGGEEVVGEVSGAE